jgi:hypothetical protein
MFTCSGLVQQAPLQQRVYLVFTVKWLEEIIYFTCEIQKYVTGYEFEVGFRFLVETF